MINKNITWIILALSLYALVCTQTTDTADLTPPSLLSPGDGDTITNNPPIFTWHAVSGDSCDLVYRIEIANDSSFNMNSLLVSTMVPLPDTTYTPSDAFTAGMYYWHVSVRQNA